MKTVRVPVDSLIVIRAAASTVEFQGSDGPALNAKLQQALAATNPIALSRIEAAAEEWPETIGYLIN